MSEIILTIKKLKVRDDKLDVAKTILFLLDNTQINA